MIWLKGISKILLRTMNVRPDDLANLCAIFAELRTRRISQTELQRYIRKSMPIDSDSAFDVVLSVGCDYGLIRVDGDCYVITYRGEGLSKRQKQVSTSISERAGDFLLKYVYLNMESCGTEFVKFLLSFQVDTTLGTFVFYRSSQESYEENQWLKTLSRVGFLEVDERYAKVRVDYLALVNELLLRFREGEIVDAAESVAERNAVGNLAERLAMDHEKRRLAKAGLKELCQLIQHISLVDNSAGYDIFSFRGTGKRPEDRIYIEVKGTKKPNINFIWSRNERRVASLKKKKYWIYVFMNVDTQKETAQGPIRINNPESTLHKKGYEVEALDVNVSKK